MTVRSGDSGRKFWQAVYWYKALAAVWDVARRWDYSQQPEQADERAPR
jgi:hypothetical protein